MGGWVRKATARPAKFNAKLAAWVLALQGITDNRLLSQYQS